MTEDKKIYINEYFKDFKEKISRCSELYNKGYRVEAAILLCCYLDALAHYAYGYVRGKSKENYIKLLHEYSPDPDEFRAIINGRSVAEAIYKLYRCEWVHLASSTKPSSGDKFIIEVEYINDEGKVEDIMTSILFPWTKMLSAVIHIIDKLHKETMDGKRSFIT